MIKSHEEKIKNIPTNFIGKNITYKAQNFYTLLVFLSTAIYIIDNSWYIPLSDKISSKKETFITIS